MPDWEDDMKARPPGLEDVVEGARRMLAGIGYTCEAGVDDLVSWFEADTVYDQDYGLDKVVRVPLLVVHELVEIENVKRMGLKLTKDVILKNPETVDTAHMRATEVELEVALSIADVDHVRSRLENIASWIEDPSVSDAHKGELRAIRDKVRKALDERCGG